MTNKLLLIDGNSIAFKAFYALYTAMDKFTNPSGLHTSAIYGFNRMLDKVLDDEQPTDVLVAFDAGKVTFRTKMFADYKGGRAKTPTELSEQFPFIKELVNDRELPLTNCLITKLTTLLERWPNKPKIPVITRLSL